MTEKEIELKKKAEYIANTKKTIDSLLELQTALKEHEGKLVDKRFFEKHFTISNEYRNWTKYSIRAPRYDFSKHAHELYISPECSLELMSRETSHILEVTDNEINRRMIWLREYEASIKGLELLDENALVADLLAVYEKYGRPEIWGKILDSYAVKYPKE